VKLRFAILFCVACGGEKSAVVDASRSANDASVDASATSDASALAAPSWVTLVREERWEAAAAAIDALADAERKKPDVRFARASVALAQGDAKTAVTSLDSLEGGLPVLAPEIARLRARAQAIAGPFVDAGEWFASHATTNDDHVAAARAFMNAKLPSRANAECARVIGAEHKTHAQEMQAREVRLHTGEAADVIADARWLLVHGDVAESKDALAILTKEDPKHPLTQREVLERVQALADANQLEDALRVLERAPLAPQATASMTVLARARADAFMRARTRYLDAASIYRRCSTDPKNTQAATDLVWSGRALSRADHDDEAIERYADVIARFGKTADAAAATFYSARLELLHGRWDKAAARFDEYVSKFPSGADRDEALHLRALAHFEKGDDLKHARTLLEQRAGDARDLAHARMSNLAALAASKDGDRTHAIARFTDVAKSFPLTWAALVARARLTQLGAPLPAMPTSPETTQPPLMVTLPEAVATLERLGLDGAAEDALHARESEITSAAPARSVEALCIAYGKVDRARRRLQLSSQIAAADLQSAPNATTRWAWQCTYPSPFTSRVRDAEIKETLPPGLLYAVMRQESAFDADAISPARAVGVMQLLPETADTVARGMGIHFSEGDLHSPARSIEIGAHYLRDLVVHAHGSLPLAIASYNAGAESVMHWAERMKGIELDAFVESIPFAETRGYVVKVMDNLAHYDFMEQGESGIPKIELVLP
jgi:soluble lytic murein transglycosylase